MSRQLDFACPIDEIHNIPLLIFVYQQARIVLDNRGSFGRLQASWIQILRQCFGATY